MRWYEKTNWRLVLWIVYWPSAFLWASATEGFAGYISGMTMGLIIGAELSKYIRAR